MKLNNIGYLLKEGFRSIFQHGFMSFAAICVTVACLIIVGSFSALAYNLDIMVQDLNKTSEIMVYIDSDLSDAEEDPSARRSTFWTMCLTRNTFPGRSASELRQRP